jgi:predicted nucleic acid-binding protein
MSEPGYGVVCDAGPLIHLDELDCLSLLADFHPILVPAQVWQEVHQHRPGTLANSDLSLQQISVSISPDPTLQTLIRSLSLDIGEQAALSLLEQYPQSIFLTDDAAARLAAITLRYRVHGTIGVLIRAIRRQQRTREEIVALLLALPQRSSLHLRPSLLDEIIAQLQNQT